jgi:hypothetical protein
VMSIRLSCLTWSIRWRMPLCSSHSPSFAAAIFGSKTKKFQAKRPPGRSEAKARSKTQRRSAHVGRCPSERNGT